ncbi:Interferon-induced protein with tetratricopeptide repeats 1B [Nibea albiflora]|uniref:Interferon-induced protein with tetratricopeptide repeats 1B n=1 Tax=Nibea albiflora TaxID=240163 RepID=A0ACB7EN40_NIBAL|nr:Interferon-induced protein with tetratricopeptide repeats 1B [Nibea albiflora]
MIHPCTQSLFNKAAEAFSQARGAAEGPWLVVNYGNLAWLHHHLGDQAESQAYLSKVDALMEKYPSPSQDELHPEIYAEKAWTLMKFNTDKKLLAADYFQRAIRMKPGMVEWNTSYVIGLVRSFKHSKEALGADVFEEMRIAKEQDPENLYLAAVYLEQRAKRGERIEDEAQEALEKHPDSRYLKRCAALCYKWKIIHFSDNQPKQSMVDKAISLIKEVISLYPQTSLVKKMDLANMYAKSTHSQAKAEQIYQQLLESDLEPADKQVLYNNYAKYLNFDRHDRNRSIKYHMMAAKIPEQSFFRDNSIGVLEKIRDRNRHRMCREIEAFLANLQEP